MTRPQISPADVRAVLASKGIAVNRVGQLCILGIRGYFRAMGQPGVNDRGIYDDALIIIDHDSCRNYNGNTDPSIKRKNIATLCEGTHTFTAGVHGISKPSGGYPAFRCVGNVPVMRDGQGPVSHSNTINLHKGSFNSTSSEGCITVHPTQWDEFRTEAYKVLGVTEDQVKRMPFGIAEWKLNVVIISREGVERILGRSL